MSKEWFIKVKDKEIGPLSSSALKKLVDDKKIFEGTLVKLSREGNWTVASKVKGLFPVEVLSGGISDGTYSATTSADERIEDAKLNAPTPLTKTCRFCGEEIQVAAIKFRFCNEFLEGQISPVNAPPPPLPNGFVQVPAGTPPQQHKTYIQVQAPQKWSPGVAIILSFFLPGLGQMYKGQILNGLLWMICTFVGYAFFIIPGLCLHFLCMIGASMGDPTK